MTTNIEIKGEETTDKTARASTRVEVIVVSEPAKK